jgi:parallel beta-helix repeat protein
MFTFTEKKQNSASGRSGRFNSLKIGDYSSRILLSFVFIIFLSFTVNATVYYVSTAGSDSNTGTSTDKPWKSLSKVNSFSFKPGDQILFKRGEQWSGTITVNQDGASGSPITYGAYGTGAKPKIYGSENITGWTQHSGNIYKASFSKNINQLFVNEARIRPARWPNSGYANIDSKSSSVAFTSNALNSSINYKGAVWFGRTGVYHTEVRTITGQSSKTLTLDAAPHAGLDANEGFILMNKLAFLDQAGEWFYDSSTKTVYLWTPKGDSPANYTVMGSTHDYGLYSEHNYIKIEQIEFSHQAHTSIFTKTQTHITIDNVNINNPDKFGVYNTTSTKGAYIISNTKLTGANHQGTHIRMPGISITDSEFTEIALFENIGLSGNGTYYYGTAVYAVGEGTVIRHNRIKNVGYNGIFFAEGNNKIEYNFIQNTNLIKSDGGGIYTTQPSYAKPTTGSVVRYNIVINTLGSNAGMVYRHFSDGIYIDESAAGVTVEYNTVYKSTDAGIKLHKVDGNIIRYNTVLDSRYGIQVLNQSGSTKTKVNNNIIYSTANGCMDKYEPRQLHIRVSNPNAEIDNNTYRNPYESNGVFRGESYMSFADWKSKTGFDKNSKFNGTKLATGEKEKLYYNDTKVDKTINLGTKVCKDIDGNRVTGSFVLKPFTSRILVETTSETVVQNQSPVIVDQAFEITSAKAANELIGQVDASDPDANDELTYSIASGNSEGLFTISSTSGKLYAKTSISTDVAKTVVLVVKVTDNASSPLSASADVTINIRASQETPVADVISPTISSFSIPSTSATLSVPVTLSATDNTAVTGYKLAEASTAPSATDAGWLSAAPTQYTFSGEGTKTLYAWSKDAAGNISASAKATVTITLEESKNTTVEYITICEGEEYNGWTTTGTYERTVTGDQTVETLGSNQVLNGDFSSGTNSWSVWGASGYSMSLTSNTSDYISAPGSLQAKVTANGTSPSNLQLISGGKIALVAGKVYRMTFSAKATVGFTMGRMHIHKGSSPWTQYGSFDVQPVITTAWKQYSLNFTASHTASDGSFRIYLGNVLPAGHSVYFDDFVLAELTEEETISQVITTYLTVNPKIYTTENVVINEGENYMGWTASGQYTRTLESSTGCDSIVTTNLTVQSQVSPEIEGLTEDVSICEGENYLGWTISGTYTRTVTEEEIVEKLGSNQVLNGDFSSGTTSWSAWGASGYSMSLSSNTRDVVTSPGSLEAKITANGTDASSLQLMNGGKIALTAGKVYQLKFHAKATVGFTMGRIHIHKGSSPWTQYGSFDIKPVITTAWKQYSLKFKASQTASDGSFRIYLGNVIPAGHTVYFDDFMFAEISQETVTTETVITTNLTVNPIQYTTENIVINEGENYMGWTTSGIYTRTLTSDAGCDSIVTTNLSVLSLTSKDLAGSSGEMNTVGTQDSDLNYGLGESLDFQIYPNPAETYINVEYSSMPGLDTRVEIIDGNGRTVVSQKVESMLTRINFDRLTPGMYYLRSVNQQHQQVKKFIVK